jgi:hypothetical protein
MLHREQASRREFLAAGVAAAAGVGLTRSGLWAAEEQGQRAKLPVAAVVTEWRKNSHADVILTKILEGWNHDGGEGPALTLAGLYTDQVPKNDLSREMAQKHGVPIFDTIEKAVTLGTDGVPVAGVLSIGEHGDYPYTPDTNQHMYPRRRFFDEIAAALAKHGKIVPVFNDKHLSYNWADAKHMYDTARELKIPFLAGSSLPVTWRSPPVAVPMGAEIERAVGTGIGGLESYGFHAIETLQCMVERRKGGETGVAAVQALRGEAILEAESAGRWSRELLHKAAATNPAKPKKGVTDELGPRAVFYLIEYRDGLKGAVAMSTALTSDVTFACQITEPKQVLATSIRSDGEKPFLHFGHLLKAIEHTIRTGKPAYPVERTLLTTGVLDALMHSLADGGKRIETPHLAIRYEPADWPFAAGMPPERS